MKHILVPTDFSENAYQALLYAARLFEKNPCTIHILHSIEFEATWLTSRVDIGHSDQVFDELYDRADKKCEAVKARLIEDTKGYGHTFDLIATAMSLPRAMNRICEQRDVDLVVMGTKGQSGLKEVILGSNTTNVINKIKRIPVLVIPPDTQFKPLSLMAFATSFEYEFRPTHLNELIYLAKLFDSEIKILHVREDDITTDEQRKNMDNLVAILADVQCNVEWLEGGSGKTEVITNYVENNEIALLGMIYYKRNFLMQLFRESVVKKIGRQPSIPYLVIPAN